LDTFETYKESVYPHFVII